VRIREWARIIPVKGSVSHEVIRRKSRKEVTCRGDLKIACGAVQRLEHLVEKRSSSER